MATQANKGGHYIALDLAYWNRKEKYRVSIDAAHPTEFVRRRSLSPSRFQADQVTLGNAWRLAGPILIAAQGAKAKAYYGEETVMRWQDEMARQCRARWPKRPIIYRQKRHGDPVPAWATNVSCGGEIDPVLNGTSLVITWHSNVAVDAIRLGIPVVCRDGAASAISPSQLPDDDPVPVSKEIRDQFLATLAWFQWGLRETQECWRFVQDCVA